MEYIWKIIHYANILCQEILAITHNVLDLIKTIILKLILYTKASFSYIVDISDYTLRLIGRGLISLIKYIQEIVFNLKDIFSMSYSTIIKSVILMYVLSNIIESLYVLDVLGVLNPKYYQFSQVFLLTVESISSQMKLVYMTMRDDMLGYYGLLQSNRELTDNMASLMHQNNLLKNEIKGYQLENEHYKMMYENVINSDSKRSYSLISTVCNVISSAYSIYRIYNGDVFSGFSGDDRNLMANLAEQVNNLHSEKLARSRVKTNVDLGNLPGND